MSAASRNVDDLIKASNHVRHGTNFWGSSFANCTCPKQPCGGVAEEDQGQDCPEHRRTPTQQWHWAAECPSRA